MGDSDQQYRHRVPVIQFLPHRCYQDLLGNKGVEANRTFLLAQGAFPIGKTHFNDMLKTFRLWQD